MRLQAETVKIANDTLCFIRPEIVKAVREALCSILPLADNDITSAKSKHLKTTWQLKITALFTA